MANYGYGDLSGMFGDRYSTQAALNDAMLNEAASLGQLSSYGQGAASTYFQAAGGGTPLGSMLTQAHPTMQRQNILAELQKKHSNPDTPEKLMALATDLSTNGFGDMAMKVREAANDLRNSMPDESKTADVTKSIQWLKDNNMQDLAAILTANPSMVSEVMKAAMKDKGLGDTQFTISTSQVYVDQDNGQQYVIQTDPNKEPGERVTRVNIEDAFAPTKEEILKLEAKQELLKNDKKKSLDAARDAFEKADNLRFQINDFERALRASEEGGVSGVIGKYLPAFNAQTGILNSISNTLGISVINMATFGALSEREMAMAMRTNIDMSLPPAKLREMIIEQMNARSKLMNELYAAARRLSYGEVTYSEYITEVADQQIEASKYTYNKLTEAERGDVSAEKWLGLNLAQRKKFVSLRD